MRLSVAAAEPPIGARAPANAAPIAIGATAYLHLRAQLRRNTRRSNKHAVLRRSPFGRRRTAANEGEALDRDLVARLLLACRRRRGELKAGTCASGDGHWRRFGAVGKFAKGGALPFQYVIDEATRRTCYRCRCQRRCRHRRACNCCQLRPRRGRWHCVSRERCSPCALRLW